jgi:beta-ribofuranosylaminobenzene 5'-phosphate synthase
MNSATLTQQRATVKLKATVKVNAPARLHLGFVDPSASLGRRFGSLGLVIDGPQTQVEVSAADVGDAFDACKGSATVLASNAAAALEVDRATAFMRQLQERTGRHQQLQLRLLQVLPAHAGLGSGTQLALAVGRAFARWHGLQVASAQLALWLGRGLRSGVGVAGFDQGGLLLDGGPGANGHVAPLLARHTLPSAWRVLLVQDPRIRGLSGADEKLAIARLPPLPQSAAADISHQVLMRILPGAADGDFDAFAAGINRVQQVLGEHFAPAQGGSAYTSAAVAQAIRHWPDAAAGQSSWGPTGFAIFPSSDAAQYALQAARAAGAVDAALRISLVAPRATGATIHDTRT